MSDQSPRDPLLGARLGSSQIERLLGAGGMSAVYLARQERPRRLVALKALRPQLGFSREQWPLFLARFRREADAMAALDHANITPIYEFGERDDLAYLVMPYLPDGSLADALEREGPLPVERVIADVEQVAAALDYAHRHGIIHRDVKPSNVLLHPDGRLLLSDFGIARPLDMRDLPGSGQTSANARGDLTMVGAAIGTPDFMAPEQVLGKTVSPATDIYALGALAYTLLAGRTPFGGGGAQQTLNRQLREPPQPLRLDRPDVPPRIEETIFWALAKDPNERPPTAGAFAQALRASQRGGPFAAGAALWRRVATPGASLSSFAERESQATPVVSPTPRQPTRMEPVGPNAATVYDARYNGDVSAAGGAAAWPARAPGKSRANSRALALSPGLIAGISAALVVLLLMAVTLGSLLGGSNPLSSLLGAGGPGTSTPSVTVAPTATASPTPSPSPTPPANWLSASTDSITLGCSGSHRTQYVRLKNLGNLPLDWQEQTNATLNFTGITVKPTNGTLPPGGHTTITVTNTTPFISHSGELDFSPTGDNADSAGADVIVSYTANCGG